MTRLRRSYLPANVFHLTSRTQGKARIFATADVRSRIVEFIGDAVRASDVRLLAYAVMSNHLHLLVRQGRQDLERLMQPLLTRVAMLVRRTNGAEGHVFERRFRDKACLTPGHIRNAVVYDHLNPVWAGLSSGPGDYPYTSHALYAEGGRGDRPLEGLVRAELALPLFGPGPGSSLDAQRAGYRRRIAWRMAAGPPDDYALDDDASHTVPAASLLSRGDVDWAALYPGLFPPPGGIGAPEEAERSRPLDIRAVAEMTLAQVAPELELEQVRSARKIRAVVRAKYAVIQRLSDAGFKGSAIARFMRLSPQRVSEIIRGR